MRVCSAVTAAAIHAESLGKNYRRGLQSTVGLRHVMESFIRAPLQSLRRSNHETFWALRDVSLDVLEGEVLGLIGRNGAGKTTLLKILSRITQPTTGFARIHGRVGSLLEVGTGFHPELTGRENTFLSGAILGMSKRDITRKFDEIVAFAELEKFIDTPVKHYSSGMYVRLAFAVAAHLEPEILLVDEVLAVGDVNFQKKCLGKMGDVARAGRTVVLVSHQLNQIRRLCNRVVWIDDGSVRQNGATHDVVSAFEAAMSRGEKLPSGESSLPRRDPHKTSKARFVRWEIVGTKGEAHIIRTFDAVTVRFTIDIGQSVLAGHYGIALRNLDQQVMWAWETQGLHLDVGERYLCHTFPILPLRPGVYTWLVALYEAGDPIDTWECLPEMMVATEVFQHPQDKWAGVLNIPVNFELKGRE
jgi:ABC-type polysaccharide/polyol phosphate transport system ATPase subunit